MFTVLQSVLCHRANRLMSWRTTSGESTFGRNDHSSWEQVKRRQQYRAVGPQDQTCNTEVMSSSLDLTAHTIPVLGSHEFKSLTSLAE